VIITNYIKQGFVNELFTHNFQLFKSIIYQTYLICSNTQIYMYIKNIKDKFLLRLKQNHL